MALLEVQDLRTHFRTDNGWVRAVDGVSFNLDAHEVLGIVGESGSGKSVTNLTIMGLIPQPPGKVMSGKILFDGKDLLTVSKREMLSIRGRRIAMIFQDPMTSLNPYLKISRQLTEGAMEHFGWSEKKARDKAVELLDLVEIPSARQRIDDYPHNFSGGMRQRVMIAMALMCDPEVLIADEPTTALDVTIQAQILDLLKKINREKGTGIILITHSLGVVAGTCDRVLVMYGGRIVEEGSVDQIFYTPQHPYTQGLLSSIPRLDSLSHEALTPIPGQPPDLLTLGDECAFRFRCPKVFEPCGASVPQSFSVGEQHSAACFLHAPS